jgi:hypothetical protein
LANADHFANVRYWHLADIGALQERRFRRYDALSEAGQRPHEAARLYNFFVIGTTMWPIHIRAQQLRKMPRIGVLLPDAPATWSLRSKALLDGLRDLGYVEGRTID